MDFKLVKQLKEADIFTPVTKDDVADRRVRQLKDVNAMASVADELPILKDIHEGNIFKTGKLTDAQWAAIVVKLVEQNPELGVAGLKQLEDDLMGFLMAADDATDRSVLKGTR